MISTVTNVSYVSYKFLCCILLTCIWSICCLALHRRRSFQRERRHRSLPTRTSAELHAPCSCCSCPTRSTCRLGMRRPDFCVIERGLMIKVELHITYCLYFPLSEKKRMTKCWCYKYTRSGITLLTWFGWIEVTSLRQVHKMVPNLLQTQLIQKLQPNHVHKVMPDLVDVS